jgi:hypothetical protein
MKDFLKNNQQNIILIVVVALVSSVMFYFALGFKSKTEELKAEKNTLEGQTSAINNTKFLLDLTNSEVADKNIDLVRGGFNSQYKSLVDKYNYNDDSVESMTVEDAQEKFDDAIRAFNSRLANSGVRVKDAYEYSFDGVSQKIFQMKMDEKKLIFEQLSAVQAIVNIVSTSKVKELSSIIRKSGLETVKTGESFVKVYTFSLTVEVAPEQTQKLVNDLSNDPSFYFRLNNLNITSPKQVDESLKSLVGIEVDEVVKEKADNDLDALLGALDTPTQVDVVAAPINELKNRRAFLPIIQTVQIDFDWVQFKESYLIKE